MNERDQSRLYFTTRQLDRRLRAVERALGLPSPEQFLSSSSKIPGVRAESPMENADDPNRKPS